MTTEIQEFTALAREYCALCDEGLPRDANDCAHHLFQLLARLCAAATNLPWADPTDRPEPHTRARPAAIPAFERDSYLECFDPFEHEEPPVMGSLSDDLSDIYSDLRQGLDYLEQGTPENIRDAVWEWKYSFNIHWGEHATGAMRAFYWIGFRSNPSG